MRALLRGASIEEATDGAIRYRAPADAGATEHVDASVDVHPEFARYSRDQLAITSIDFIGRKPSERSS